MALRLDTTSRRPEHAGKQPKSASPKSAVHLTMPLVAGVGAGRRRSSPRRAAVGRQIHLLGGGELDATASGNVSQEEEPVATLAAEEEEPFCLEPLESLIQAHAQEGRDFLLARVLTRDPRDPKRHYYSHYAAHHINKVLFRTQPEEGLLHRMRAKNPLNNMEIEGDVHYYVIKAADVLAAAAAASPSPTTSSSPLTFERLVPPDSPVHRARSTSPPPPSSASTMGLHDGSRPAELLDQLLQRARAWTTRATSASPPLRAGVPPPSRRLYLLMRPEVWEAGTEKVAPLFDTRRLSIDASTRPPTSGGGGTRGGGGSRRNSADDAFTREAWLGARQMPKGARSPPPAHATTTPTRKGKSRSWRRQSGQIGEPSSPCLPAYQAHFYATDDDFLMKASVRAYFAAQALEADHAVLFTLHSGLPFGADGGGIALPRTHPHPTLEGFEYQLAEEEDGESWASMARTLRTVRYAVLLYLGVGGTMLWLFVPPEFRFVSMFGLVFVLCLALIIYL